MKFKFFFIGLCLCVSSHSFAVEKTTIRIGVQASGTLEWELLALQDDPQVKSADFQLEIQPVANSEAGKIALQAGSVDMIVSVTGYGLPVFALPALILLFTPIQIPRGLWLWQRKALSTPLKTSKVSA